ncbi:hypothetical protein LP420_19265 [Massilia sp. B-10]|nr:hypothetical protein LP420_19265 [Massilia sp. B-10]
MLSYLLAPELASAIDALDAASLAPDCPVHWFEVVAAAGRPVPCHCNAHCTAMGRAEHRQRARRAVLVDPGNRRVPGTDRGHLRGPEGSTA